jgi:O-antigen ligase
MHLPSNVALVIYAAVILWLFGRDFREKPNVTGALWLPFFWMFISGTRFISQWLAIFGLNFGGVSVEEGSPLDAVVFAVLIIGGLRVLSRRQVRWSEFIRNNPVVALYFAYCLVAVLWSDFPLVAVKRWVKLFGQPVMVLLVLTEPDPMESFTRLMKRFAFLLIPLSILFIKYYPQWATCYDNWTGGRVNTGVTTDKNMLGCDCFILGFFFLWHFLRVRRWDHGTRRTTELVLCLMFGSGIIWLFHSAHSSTPIGALVIAVSVFFFVGFKFVDRRHLGVYLVGIVAVLAVLEYAFDLHKVAIAALGRNTTLTGRTAIWQVLLHWDLNPILGMGFESFWLGDAQQGKLHLLLSGMNLNEAHNGYLETYLNLGLVGLAITLLMLGAAYFKIRRALLTDFEFGRFRLGYLAAFVVYNWTEAIFRTHCVPFFIFFLVAVDYYTQTEPEAASEAVVEAPPDPDLAVAQKVGSS